MGQNNELGKRNYGLVQHDVGEHRADDDILEQAERTKG